MFDPPVPGCEIMPVFSSGQTARQAPGTYQALMSKDLIFACGGIIVLIQRGSLRGRARDSAGLGSRGDGISLEDYARTHSGLEPVPADLRRMNNALLCYYGDDFTGSTDALEALAANGVPGVLFLNAPDEHELLRFPECRVIGVAGESRSRDPEWMSEHLPPVFRKLKAYGAPLCLYKVCSTFDSSPDTGNIGRAIEIGQDVLGGPYVPLSWERRT